MDSLALIEQAATRYRRLDLVGADIETAIRSNEIAALPELCERLSTLQEQAKIGDSQLFTLLRRRQELLDMGSTQEWLRRMQSIQDRNQRLLPHIKSMMAIHRSEIHTLRKGNSMLQGYKPGMVQTERRFSSSG